MTALGWKRRDRRSRFAAILLATSATIVAANSALAQKAPDLGYMFPPVIRAGEATTVQLGGFDFTSDMQVFSHDPDVGLQILSAPGEYHLPPPPFWTGPRASIAALPIPREVEARVEVASSRPPGLVRWQVANANGAASAAMCYVSHGRETIEERFRDEPQRLEALPVAVSGRLSRLTEVDRYELTCDRDGPMTVELMSRRLGANFQGMLQVHDESGALVAEFADTLGRDGSVTFAGRAGSRYTASLFDADFRGDRTYIYRLAFSVGPRVVATVPAYGQRGTSQDVEFIGYGLTSATVELQTVRQSVAFPADTTLTAMALSLDTPLGRVEVPIPLTDVQEQVDVGGDAPVQLNPAVGVTGRFAESVDERRYTWQSAKDAYWAIELQSRGIRSSLDVAVEIQNAEGKTLIENDDLPGLTDAALEFRAPVDGLYTCIVRCLSPRNGSLDEIYHLQIKPQSPGFRLTAPQMVNVPSGGKVDIAIQAARLAGFNEPITLNVEGLPPGVTPVGDLVIPAGKKDTKLSLQAAADAAVTATQISIRGAAMSGEGLLTATATAVAEGNLAPRSAAEQTVETLLMAMTMTPPFDLNLIDRTRQRDVHRGTTCLAEFDIVRHEGFSGEILLEMAAKQARYRRGINGPNVVVPPGAARAIYPSFMPECLATDLTERMAVQGVAAVPDPQGNVRYLTKAADAQITMILEGALLKISSPLREPTLRRGASMDVPIVIARSAKLPLPATISLDVPPELKGALNAEPLVLPPGQNEGTLRVTATNDVRLTGAWALILGATAFQDDKWRVYSQTELPIVFSD